MNRREKASHKALSKNSLVAVDKRMLRDSQKRGEGRELNTKSTI
jgi:hypothetical protein